MAHRWGTCNGFIRADRQLRQFAQEGYCERLNLSQKLHKGLMKPENTEIAWFDFRPQYRVAENNQLEFVGR